jgi:hypothetical protein
VAGKNIPQDPTQKSHTMSLQHHAAISIILSGVLYALFKSWGIAIASLLGGILIDLDHIIDYVREYGIPIDLKKFFHTFYETKYRTLLLILHGWEWLIFLAVAAYLTDWNHWILGFLIGYGHHLVLDQLNNDVHVWTYSVVWRWKNGFNAKTAFPGARTSYKK